LLLEAAEIPLGSTVLDVGCGYGVIGVTAAARGARPMMFDSDSRAVALALTNLRRNHLSGEAMIATGLDDFEEGSFDIVLANPPTHGGQVLLSGLFRGMIRVCRTTGYSAIVVHAHLNYERWMRDFSSIEKIADADGYKVLKLIPATARRVGGDGEGIN
jgi:16S rRNA (guanine1207-N2)-methyltransferase